MLSFMKNEMTIYRHYQKIRYKTVAMTRQGIELQRQK